MYSAATAGLTAVQNYLQRLYRRILLPGDFAVDDGIVYGDGEAATAAACPYATWLRRALRLPFAAMTRTRTCNGSTEPHYYLTSYWRK